ncbi:glycoside hydrolase family 99-like domain-containing protein [Pseudomonas paralcaligenes]|uniref:glycoside hydrolase family 99-like domain-containing protein n=1 Tax=Pseudomonas paralcaligenes TaxID=2772558 RepID=UPI001C80085C|nr:glycoside hydrolase family 99-like domain-containing protein [Pseudomonas paralcaligenes]
MALVEVYMSVGLTRVFVVLGMHRSGTSVITRALKALGVELGDNLMPAAENNNEKGFFEDLDIHELNTRLLHALGTSWDRLGEIDLAHCLDSELAPWRDEALAILRAKLPEHGLFAFKDPQTCLLLPFWQRVLAELSLEPCYLICLRNPLSVAASLHKRDDITPARAQLLWAHYQLAALRYSEGARRIVVDYDAMLDQPLQQLARIATAFDMPLPEADSDEMREFEQDFLSQGLRHTRHSAEQLGDRAQVPQPVAALYQLLRRVATDQLDLQDVGFSQGCTELAAALHELKPLAQALDAVDHERLQIIGSENETILGLNGTIQALDSDCQQLRDQLVACNVERENAWNMHGQVLQDRHELAGKLNDSLSQQDELRTELMRIQASHLELNETIRDLSETTQALNETIRVLDNERHQLNDQLAASNAECENAWHMHAQALQHRHELAGELNDCLLRQDQLRAELAQVYAGHSWRLTRPIRGLRRHYQNPGLLVRALGSESVRWLWRLLPLSTGSKQAFKHRLFTHAGPLLRKTRAYQNWQWSQEQGRQPERSLDDTQLQWIDEPVEAVPQLQSHAQPVDSPVRLIAFYLPQFHPIPENDAWWGEGFTEWTNVRPAQPLYEGHYQPHVPGDLGYYDLLDGQTQRRQVELAKQYGLGGFCFYFYWFGGKRLLETPVERYLADASLDLPFCLCWANENWSRRWDGLDHEILIGQDHSPEDDLAFIAHIAQYMRDSRYIRIDGKPLLLVYRPSLLPDAKATALRWRTWCRENGIGEIYLAYTQSFDNPPPSRFGFDAAIEFPPNATNPPSVTGLIKPLQEDFQGQVYDWSIYLKRCLQYGKPGYKLFRSVCPSWDNTARRRNCSISFVNSSPRGYQQWLLEAMRETLGREQNPDERIVFINAWNEWAEGAHLEPDQRYGYGFLEATRMASLRASLPAPAAPARETLAVVIHAYYPEVLQEILGYLQQIEGLALQFYLSCPPDKAQQVRKILADCRHPWTLEETPNRGRDVLPFMKLLPRIVADGHTLLLKVHTKKSTHREDGDVWRRDLYDKLLTGQAMRQALETFALSPSTGILGPAGHLVPMSFYWGSNARRVEGLACRLGISPADLSEMNFVAGTMFFAQTRTFLPLLNLALSEDDFEEEAGQVDGTLAHALERTFSISARAVGLDVSSGESRPANQAYAFADATP